ncbi:MAG: acetyltransferase [Gloeobacterales cyanobacterium]
MFLSHKAHHEIIEVLNLQELFDPLKDKIRGRFHAGEELQDPEAFSKSELEFPSGEPLPQCWINAHYRENPEPQTKKVAMKN